MSRVIVELWRGDKKVKTYLVYVDKIASRTLKDKRMKLNAMAIAYVSKNFGKFHPACEYRITH